MRSCQHLRTIINDRYFYIYLQDTISIDLHDAWYVGSYDDLTIIETGVQHCYDVNMLYDQIGDVLYDVLRTLIISYLTCDKIHFFDIILSCWFYARH